MADMKFEQLIENIIGLPISEEAIAMDFFEPYLLEALSKLCDIPLKDFKIKRCCWPPMTRWDCFCRDCWREDLKGRGDPIHLYGRQHWSKPFAFVCSRHKAPLVYEKRARVEWYAENSYRTMVRKNAFGRNYVTDSIRELETADKHRLKSKLPFTATEKLFYQTFKKLQTILDKQKEESSGRPRWLNPLETIEDHMHSMPLFNDPENEEHLGDYWVSKLLPFDNERIFSYLVGYGNIYKADDFPGSEQFIGNYMVERSPTIRRRMVLKTISILAYRMNDKHPLRRFYTERSWRTLIDFLAYCQKDRIKAWHPSIEAAEPLLNFFYPGRAIRPW